MPKKVITIILFCILLAVGWFAYRNENSNSIEYLKDTSHSIKPTGSSPSEPPIDALQSNDAEPPPSPLSSFAPSEDDSEEARLFQITAVNHAALLSVTKFIVPSNNSQPKTRPTISEKQATKWIRVLYRDAVLASYLSSDLSDLLRLKTEDWLNQPEAPEDPTLLVVGPHLPVNYLQRVKRLLDAQTATGIESEQTRQGLIPELMDMTKRRKRLSDNYMKRWLGPFLVDDAVPLADKIALGRQFRTTQDWGLYRFTMSYMTSRMEMKNLDEEQLATITQFMNETKSNDK